jgi:hypothetical protein
MLELIQTPTTIDEIVDIWKKNKVVYVITTLPEGYATADSVAKGGFAYYIFNNLFNREDLFRQVLEQHTTPLFLGNLTESEYLEFLKQN